MATGPRVGDALRVRSPHASEAEARRLFLAGGGSEGSFAVHFARGMASLENIVRGLNEGTYHGIIGGAFYLVAGRKPASHA